MSADEGNTTKFPLIISTGTGKADPKTRKLIRSYVMRGKNRVKPSKKSKKLVHVVAPQPNPCSFNDSCHAPSIPRILSSKFAAISFAADVESSLVEDVLQFAAMSSRAMFLLSPCIEPAGSDVSKVWFAPMLSDPAYLYAACFTIQTYFDGYLERTRSAEALRRDNIYYGKTIKLLQDRLGDDDDSARLSDSTIMTVMTLSGHAYSMGDYASANQHIEGLLKLVSMRGADTFFHNTRMLIEIVRSDLVAAVDKCGTPVLFTGVNLPWPLISSKNVETSLDVNDCSNSLPIGGTTQLLSLTSDLSVIWITATEFCEMLNTITDGQGPPIVEETFLYYMGSIMYRLLFQQFETASRDEAFRLGLLAFLSPIFLNWNRVELPDRRFNDRYQEALIGLTLSDSDMQPQERLWLFMVAALSMSHESDRSAWPTSQLRKDMRLCGITSWNAMRKVLSSYLWVGLIYDRPGKEIFDSIFLECT